MIKYRHKKTICTYFLILFKAFSLRPLRSLRLKSFFDQFHIRRILVNDFLLPYWHEWIFFHLDFGIEPGIIHIFAFPPLLKIPPIQRGHPL
jgi:hypothetical protein